MPKTAGRRQSGDARIDAEQTRRRGVPGADAAAGVDRHHAGRDAIEHRLDVAAAALDVAVLAFELDRRALEPPAAGRQLAGHAVERLDQRAELVAGFRLHAMIEVAGADLVGRRGQHLHRPRDALGEVQPHPGRADENHQRQHQEERQVDAGERLLQARAAADRPRTPRSCRARVPRTGRSGTRWRRRRRAPARSATSGSAPRCESGRRRSDELLDRRAPRLPLAAARSARRSADAREYSRGSRRRRDVDDRCDLRRPSAQVADAIDLDQLDALLQHVGRDEVADVGRTGRRGRRVRARARAAGPAPTRGAAAAGSSRRRCAFADDSTSSIGALNQRSTLLRMSSLPTISTSTAGINVIPSSTATSLARKRANGSARRRSTTSLTMLRARTKTSATRIVRLVAESA